MFLEINEKIKGIFIEKKRDNFQKCTFLRKKSEKCVKSC